MGAWTSGLTPTCSATIQTAVNFLINVDPGKEKQAESELFPHVAAAMAAYGPSTAYANFLNKQQSYQSKSFWFYNQPSALRNAPTSKSGKRSAVVWRREDGDVGEGDGGEDSVGEGGVTGALDPNCPLKTFANAKEVEIDNGIWVNCTELLPFFDL